MAILYLCDRKACENCSDKCKHTTDIRHAANFEQYHADGVEAGDFWEKGSELTIPSAILNYRDLGPSDFNYSTSTGTTKNPNNTDIVY